MEGVRAVALFRDDFAGDHEEKTVRITSDMGKDSTVAGSNVPLLTRDAEGNEIDWRKQYICTCPPTDDPTTPPECPGCIALRGLLDRLRADRRTRAVRESSERGPAPSRSRGSKRDENVA